MKTIDDTILQEIQFQELMDRAVKTIKKDVSSNGQAIYNFVIEKETPNINEYPEDVKYEVKFGSLNERNITINRPEFSDQVSVNLRSSSLIFRNETSDMTELSKYMQQRYGYDPRDYKFSALAVYGTISRIIFDYFRKVPKAQGLNFITAHRDLVKPYIILAKEAEKKGILIWARPFQYDGRTSADFDLVKMESYTKIKDIIMKKKEQI